MDVDELLPRPRDVEQRVAPRRHVAEPSADREEEVGGLDPSRERGIHADRQRPRVALGAVVDVVLATERGHDRNPVLLAEGGHGRSRQRAPATFADDHERARGGAEQLPESAQLIIRRRRPRHLGDSGVSGVRLVEQYVLRQREHDRPRARRERRRERARHVLRDAVGVVHLRRPLRHRAEDGRVVELLERFATEMFSRYLADKEDHRRRVLVGRVHAGRRVCRARAARDEADAGPPRQLAVRLSHVRRGRLVPAGDEADRRVVERVEDREVALPRDAERELDAMELQLIDERPPAGAGHLSSGASRKIVARWSFGLSSSPGSR